jgi:hypothetical protein
MSGVFAFASERLVLFVRLALELEVEGRLIEDIALLVDILIVLALGSFQAD